MTKVLRLLLTAILLLVVWKNSHWSVALSITLILVNTELTISRHLERLATYKTERAKTEYKLFSKLKNLTRTVDGVNKKAEYACRQSSTAKQPKASTKFFRNEPRSDR